MAKVLIIEGNRQFNDEIAHNLRELGYRYIQAHTIDEAFECNLNDDIGVVIINVGISYDRRIVEILDRSQFNIPVMLLKASVGKFGEPKSSKEIAKARQFEIMELMARVQATLGKIKCKESVFPIGDNVVVDLRKKRVKLNDNLVELTRKEFELLEALIINRNVNMSRERILEMVWSGDFDENTRTVDVHIRNLRKKLQLEKYIKTVYKIGYKLEV